MCAETWKDVMKLIFITLWILRKIGKIIFSSVMCFMVVTSNSTMSINIWLLLSYKLALLFDWKFMFVHKWSLEKYNYISLTSTMMVGNLCYCTNNFAMLFHKNSQHILDKIFFWRRNKSLPLILFNNRSEMRSLLCMRKNNFAAMFSVKQYVCNN